MLLLQLHVGRTHAWRLSDQGEGSELAVATSMEGKGKERVASCSDSRADRQSEKEESCSDLSMCSLCFAFGARTQTQAGGRVASRRNCLFTTTPTSAAVVLAVLVRGNETRWRQRPRESNGAAPPAAAATCSALPCRAGAVVVGRRLRRRLPPTHPKA